MGRHLSNLPAEVTSFVGRRQELREVKRLLSTTRLLTLTGSGGAGKDQAGAAGRGRDVPRLPGRRLAGPAGLRPRSPAGDPGGVQRARRA